MLIPFDTEVRIPVGKQFSFNAGYLFLQKIYYQLGLPSTCKKVTKNHSFDYDLNSILSRLVYGRILYPSSKLSYMEQSKSLIEQPNFELSKFIICTDAGLSSEANRKFNNYGERSFITTQSIKKLKAETKAWALDPTGWSLEGSNETFDIYTYRDNR